MSGSESGSLKEDGSPNRIEPFKIIEFDKNDVNGQVDQFSPIPILNMDQHNENKEEIQ